MKKIGAILRILIILMMFTLFALTPLLKMHIKNNDVNNEHKQTEYQSVTDTQNSQETKAETESKEE